VLASAIEHPAVRNTVLSLGMLGFDAQLIPVDQAGQVDPVRFEELLTPETVLVSIHQVNNILGSVLPVEELARVAKRKVPGVVFHSDAVQAFGKIQTPVGGSPVDLVSISGHKVEGPKGVGALVVLNTELIKNQKLRPFVWGGEQEGGFRSGTQNAGLIAGFAAAARQMTSNRAAHEASVRKLRDRLRTGLEKAGLLGSMFTWNSPEDGLPHIVSLCLPTLPAQMVAQLLDEQGYMVSTGSACSSGKTGPDAVLTALSLPPACRSSNLRISFSHRQSVSDVDGLVDALARSVAQLGKMMTG
jgi:cysteine desulfurase